MRYAAAGAAAVAAATDAHNVSYVVGLFDFTQQNSYKAKMIRLTSSNDFNISILLFLLLKKWTHTQFKLYDFKSNDKRDDIDKLLIEFTWRKLCLQWILRLR